MTPLAESSLADAAARVLPAPPRLPLSRRSRAGEPSSAARLRLVSRPPRSTDTAAELDRRLRALSGRAARCRLVQGCLAALLLSRRGWFALGFVRPGDYASERLGIGVRLLEEEARVALRLQHLPRITAAFLGGSLTWTALRLITGVATERDEEHWIAQAAALDTRALSEVVRAAAATGLAAAGNAGDVDAPSRNNGEAMYRSRSEDEDDADDPRQRWAVRVSHGGRRLWRAACEMASRTAGTRLTPAQVLELVAAEASSGGGGGGGACGGGAMFGWSRFEAGEDAGGGAEAAHAVSHGEGIDQRREPEFVEGASREPMSSYSPSRSGDAAASTARCPTASSSRCSVQEQASSAVAPGRGRLADLLAAEIERNPGAPATSGLPFLTLDDARELEERDPLLAAFYAELLAGDGDGRSDHADLPPLPPPPEHGWFEKALREIGRAEGFAWLTDRPDRPPSTPGERLEAELRAIEDADPHTIDARLREVRRAAQAVDFELAALLDDAAGRRLHLEFGLARFEQYVETRLGLRPRTAWSLLSIGRAVRRCCPLLGEAWKSGRVSTLAARILLPVVGTAGGGGNSGSSRSSESLETDRQWIARAGLVTLRRLEAEVDWALDRRDECGVSGGAVADGVCAANGEAVGDAGGAIAPPPLDLDLAGHALAAVTTDGLQMRAQAGGPDPAAAGDDRGVEIAFFAPESVIFLAEGTIHGLRHGFESRGRAFERMLALALLEWMATPRHRDPVFERDGWRCAVPGCSSRRNLHDHHVVFRSRGGDNARDNRITVCAAHHLHGLHRGRIRAAGTAPHAIEWEIGIRFGFEAGRPLARLVGDRYVDGR